MSSGHEIFPLTATSSFDDKGEGVRSRLLTSMGVGLLMIFDNKGGGGRSRLLTSTVVGLLMTFDDKGGGGVKRGRKFDDVIVEQPLTRFRC